MNKYIKKKSIKWEEHPFFEYISNPLTSKKDFLNTQVKLLHFIENLTNVFSLVILSLPDYESKIFVQKKLNNECYYNHSQMFKDYLKKLGYENDFYPTNNSIMSFCNEINNYCLLNKWYLSCMMVGYLEHCYNDYKKNIQEIIHNKYDDELIYPNILNNNNLLDLIEESGLWKDRLYKFEIQSAIEFVKNLFSELFNSLMD